MNMQGVAVEKRECVYINSGDKNAKKDFGAVFSDCLIKTGAEKGEIVIICIGTDRATGDSLGPLTGYKLAKAVLKHENIKLYGTLDKPVHAKNLLKIMALINEKHPFSTIVAIDACLGKVTNIGHLSIGLGSVRPGAGVQKTLPSVGDIFITGIVNMSGQMETFVLQNTRLNVVMKMADVISDGIIRGINITKNTRTAIKYSERKQEA